MEHGLKTVDGVEPSEIEKTAERIREIPGDHYAVGKLLQIAGTRHPRLQKHRNGRGFVDQFAGDLCQSIEPF